LRLPGRFDVEIAYDYGIDIVRIYTRVLYIPEHGLAPPGPTRDRVQPAFVRRAPLGWAQTFPFAVDIQFQILNVRHVSSARQRRKCGIPGFAGPTVLTLMCS
jgi:hypothetical protein